MIAYPDLPCDGCHDRPPAHRVEEIPFDWWGIEAGMPAELCEGCYRAWLEEDAKWRAS